MLATSCRWAFMIGVALIGFVVAAAFDRLLGGLIAGTGATFAVMAPDEWFTPHPRGDERRLMIGIDLGERQLEELLRTGYTEYRTGPNALYPAHTWVKLDKAAQAFAQRLLGATAEQVFR